MQQESIIRDILAKDLSVIEPNLKFLYKEYKLPNFIGSKGFVDILATDIYNNYVIIEIKRSKASSRETLQEIIKYVGLIKQNFKAKDSEIRIIILSTHWEELFVPFCEFTSQSSLYVKGYQLNLDNTQTLVNTREVVPEKLAIQRRQFARTYEFALFHSKEKRDKYVATLAAKSKAVGISDFVISSLFLKDKKIYSLYSYATCYSFNEHTIKYYLSLDSIKKEMDSEEDEFELKSEFISYLEQCVLCAINESSQYDSIEIGSPEKFQKVLQIEGWEIDFINRYGIFKSDPRLTDEMLIKELKGYNGSNKCLYSNFADSAQRDRLEEVILNCLAPFECNTSWWAHLDNLLQHIKNQKKAYRMSVHVYHPDSIFYGIYQFLKFKSVKYLPMYCLYVDYYNDDELQIFEGTLRWNGAKIDEKKYKKFILDDEDVLISKGGDICMGYFDIEILKHFKLEFKTKQTTLASSNERKSNYFQIDKSGMIKTDTRSSHSLVNWVQRNPHFCWNIMQLFEANTFSL